MMLFFAEALFIGNQACAPCHTQIYRSYVATPMAQSTGRVMPGTIPAGALRHSSSGVDYRIDSAGLVSFAKGGTQGQRQLHYFIGSSAAGRSFIVSRAGFLFQAPVTWYSQKSRWDVSPGYENDTTARWSRPIEPSCLYCHSSAIRHIDVTQNQYSQPPFAQEGIACERCHGAGSDHIHGKSGMINPAKLDATRRDAICAQCHLSGEARIEKTDRRIADFRPGQLLSEYVSYFVYEGRQSVFKATSHVEKMYASRCKQASGERLWCGTCHDPHAVPAAGNRSSWYRTKCLGCHEPEVCKRGDDCITCHMPKGRVVDGGHGVLTDHSIPRATHRLAFESPAPWRLAGFSRGVPGTRELGLAYAEVFLKTGDRRQRDEAIRLLEQAPRDTAVAVRLADLYQRTGRAGLAEELYRVALEREPSNRVALVNLAGIVASRGGLVDAIAMWRAALKQNPCLDEAAMNLVTALSALGDRAEAEAVQQARTACGFHEQ